MNSKIFLLMLVIIVFSVGLSGCSDQEEEGLKFRRLEEEARVKRLAEMREGMSGYLVFAAIVVVLGGICLAPLLEKGRSVVVNLIGITCETQVCLAQTAFVVVSILVLTFAISNPNLSPIFPAVLILVGGTAYPFFVHYIPGLQQSDLMRRKAAMNQIKSFLMMILVIYILMNILTPEGIFSIVLK